MNDVSLSPGVQVRRPGEGGNSELRKDIKCGEERNQEMINAQLMLALVKRLDNLLNSLNKCHNYFP